MRCDVHGRIADGVRAASAVGNTVDCFTDGHGRAVLAACSWLEVNGGAGRALPYDRPAARVVPGTRAAAGTAGALLAGLAVWESCRLGLGTMRPAVVR